MSTRITKTQFEELQKKLAEAERTKDMWYKNYCEASTKLDEIHSFIDACLPEALGRKHENGYSENSIVLRLSSFFVRKLK